MNPGDLSLADRLERIEGKQDVLLQAVTDLHLQIAILKAKAAIYGGGAGLILGAVIPAIVAKFI